MAYAIAKKINKNIDFEIHVGHEDDGSFKIWYRELS